MLGTPRRVDNQNKKERGYGGALTQSFARRKFAHGLCAGLPAAMWVAASFAQISPSRPMPQTVTVKVGAEGTERVPDTIFGSFLEPIGDSINQGLVAEILVNGSLEAGLWNHTNLENMFRDEPELIDATNQTGIPLPWR